MHSTLNFLSVPRPFVFLFKKFPQNATYYREIVSEHLFILSYFLVFQLKIMDYN